MNMDKSETEEVREFWNRVADDWEIQVGDEGDSNRRLNSDPVLWQLAGDVRGMDVLDVGCGTGYLSRKLKDRGADVTGIDLSVLHRLQSQEAIQAPGMSPK
jgi:2-polyprenyl-3-methyl-5-hydroxy-6-metoxy-1,4-benzoquinol methylase